jgi:hypothetical protein
VDVGARPRQPGVGRTARPSGMSRSGVSTVGPRCARRRVVLASNRGGAVLPSRRVGARGHGRTPGAFAARRLESAHPRPVPESRCLLCTRRPVSPVSSPV